MLPKIILCSACFSDASSVLFLFLGTSLPLKEGQLSHPTYYMVVYDR